MRFPISSSLLLLVQSRGQAFSHFFATQTCLASSSFFSSSSTAFVHPRNSDKSSRNLSSLKATIDDVSSLESQIKQEALASLDISSPSTLFKSTFANLTFINTQKLMEKKQHRVLFILGGPGAGKGTQSENILKEYKCIHLSVGELLRQERTRTDSQHATLIEECLVKGQIVPVEISLQLVKNAMADSSQEYEYGAPIFLVDGFPRNFDNLQGWTREMPDDAAVLGSLVYDCPIEILEERILARAETSGRSDDNLDSARKRFDTFQQQTMPVVQALEEIEKYEIGQNEVSRIVIQHIRGERTVEQVWEETQDAMNAYVRNDVLTNNARLLQAVEEKDEDAYSALCSDEFLSAQEDDHSLMQEYETIHGKDNLVSMFINASIEHQGGTKAIVTYERVLKDQDSGEVVADFKESRVWSHDAKGWVCVHFVRTPLEEEEH